MTSPRARTQAAAGPYRLVSADRAGKMLSRQEAAQARRCVTRRRVRSIARHLRRSPVTIRAYLTGTRQPGKRAPHPDTFLPFADYSRRRFTDDRHLGTRTLSPEWPPWATRQLPDLLPGPSAPPGAATRLPAMPDTTTGLPAAPAQSRQARPLPIPVALIAGEVLASCLGGLAAANHITIDDLLAILPPWFSTKIGNDDDGSSITLARALPGAILALATLTGRTPPSWTGRSRLRRRIPARPGPGHNRLPQMPGHPRHLPASAVHRPACDLICSRHGLWLSAAGLPSSTSQHVLRSGLPTSAAASSSALHPQQLMIAHLAAERTFREPSRQPAGQPRTRPPQRWRHRLRQLNHQPVPGRLPSRRTHPRSDLP